VRAVWHELVDDARWAPSPHNTQPWLLEPRSERQADLYVPRDRLLPVEDPEGRFLTAGLGIFTETLAVASAARGLQLECDAQFPTLGDEAQEHSLFARLSLTEGSEPDFPLELLRRRRTSRLPYDGRPVPVEALASLEELAARFGHRASFTSDPDLVDWVIALNADTVFYDLDEDDRREEIGRWTYTTDAAAARAGDGFSPRCLGFPGVLVNAFFHHHSLFRPKPVRALAHRLYRRSMAGTATVGWIAGPWQTPEQWFEAGRMLMRFWLRLTELGLHLQPFGSVITNPTSHARLTERLAAHETGEHEVWLLLRVGFSATPPRSARLLLEEVLA
jgi:hypothetical protein